MLPDDHGVWDILQAGRSASRAHAARSRGCLAIAWRRGRRSDRRAAFGVGARRLSRRLLPAIDEAEAVSQVRDGRAQAAFLLPAPSLDRLLAVAEEGDLLPAKSTWFDPKAPAGLVINDLRL